jgi:4-alpha-glucanotransferase
MRDRASGILLHLPSLPGPYGIGDLGDEAYRWVDRLASAGQRVWQILPLNATEAGSNSPYNSLSAFAVDPLILSPDRLVRDGLLERRELQPLPEFPQDQVLYPEVRAFKARLFRRAHRRFRALSTKPLEYQAFCRKNAHWLEDFCLFRALRASFQEQLWCDWPQGLRDRDSQALEEARRELTQEVEMECLLQFLLDEQWWELKGFCRQRGVQVLGDLPIYVSLDSADVWAHPELYLLDHQKRPTVLAGVPPDYFSRTGQLWGNPIYNWERLRQQDYDWWVERAARNLELFDSVRVDHFRGFAAFWQVPAGEETAVKGQWVEGPGEDLFRAIRRRLHHLPFVAEDLGIITAEVRELMRDLDLPGMKVLQFAFGPGFETNPYIPHGHEPRCLVYTGTHDNNTVRGWWEDDASEEERRNLQQYLGKEVGPDEVHWDMIRLALSSVAELAVIPLQDVLGLGSQGRMNTPSEAKGNWRWRYRDGAFSDELLTRLRELTRVYGRL